jgi:hypothetical protein
MVKRQIESITEKLPHLTESDLESLGHRGGFRTFFALTHFFIIIKIHRAPSV